MKMKGVFMKAFFVTITVLLMSSFATIAQAAQAEPSPVMCNEGVIPEPIQINYGEYTSGCAVDLTTTDLDQFRFYGAEGDVVRIIVRSHTNGFDPRVEVRDPNGTVIGDTYCYGHDVWGGGIQCTVSGDNTIITSGNYTIAVSDQGSDEMGNYTLQIEKFPPDFSAPEINYNQAPVVDGIDPTTDVDHFTFTGVAGTQVRITVRSNTNGYEPRVEIRDPSGSVITDTYCNGHDVWGGGIKCTVQFDLTLTSDGAYQLIMSDMGSDETGDYDINVQCLFGSCPGYAVTVPVCDIQMSQAVYTEGEIVTASVFRIANPGPSSVPVELKMWLIMPGFTKQIKNAGSDGSVSLPAGLNVDLSPLPLFTVSGAYPLGKYEIGCRMLEPLTGRTITLGVGQFEIQ